MVKVSRAKAAALREEILDATIAELCRVGYQATALTGVASRCGLATSAIYNRFPGKEELVSALIGERLEPELGRALDADLSALWQEEPLISLVDGDQLGCSYELQLAARHAPEIRPPVVSFVQRRLEAALAARQRADQEGRVRPGQDPRAQVLLQAAGDTGSYFLALASAVPSGGMASVDQAVRRAVTTRPGAAPIASGRPARRRLDPGPVTPAAHALDDLGAALVTAAAETFAVEGYDAATVAAIARRAGVTTGAIYNRFPGKGGLLGEVVVQVVEPRAVADAAALVEALTTGGTTEAGATIGALMARRRPLEHGVLNPLGLEARHASRLEPDVDRVVRPLQDHVLATLAGAIRRAQHDGRLRADVGAEALAWWFTAVPLGIELLDDAVTAPIDWAPTFAALVETLRTPPA